MRQHNKYLDKVRDELSVYQRYLIDESTELTTTQAENWEKIDAVRALLRSGASDSDAITMLKQSRNLQDRRCREIVALAYEVFAELRASRNKDGVKYMYAEMFRAAAKEAKDAGDYYAFEKLMVNAAKIDGAYDNQKVVDLESKKRTPKVIIKVKSATFNTGSGGKLISSAGPIDVSHEDVS